MSGDIPIEIWFYKIFIYLPLNSLPSFFSVCRNWSKISNNDIFWKNWIETNQKHIDLPKPHKPIYFKPKNRTWKWMLQIQKPINQIEIQNFTGIGYSDILSYQGEWKNGYRDGVGISFFYDGSIYMGDHMMNKASGRGIFYNVSGHKYEGEFLDGNRHGKGHLEIFDQNGKISNTYVGDFLDGVVHGIATCTHVKGHTYMGEFVKGRFHGRGKFTYLNNVVYEGKYKDGLPSGYGILRSLNGTSPHLTYNGFFSEGKKHGQGCVIYPNGYKYIGEFQNDIIHGIGHFYQNNGNEYIGQFDDNYFHGYGKFIEKNGHTIEGWWDQGCPYHSTDNIPYEIHYKNIDDLNILDNLQTFLLSNNKVWKCEQYNNVSGKIDEKLHPNIRMAMEDNICTYTITQDNNHAQFYCEIERPYDKPYYVCLVCIDRCAIPYISNIKYDVKFAGDLLCQCASHGNCKIQV